MKYCEKCGAGMPDDVLICPECCYSKDSEETSGFAEELARLSTEESIALAEKLSADYEALNNLRAEISDDEQNLRRCLNVDDKVRYSAFRFFWPYLIVSQVIAVLVMVIVILIAVAFDNRNLVLAAESFAFIAMAVTIIVGGVKARNKRDILNSNLIDNVRSKKKKAHDLSIEIEELKGKKKALEESLLKYRYVIPSALRNKSRMDMVKNMLVTGKAQGFTEAVTLCRSFS